MQEEATEVTVVIPTTLEELETQELIYTEEVEATELALVTTAGAIVVVDQVTFDRKMSIHQESKDNIKSIREHLKVAKQDAHQRHGKITALENRLVAPYETLAKESKRECIDWAEAEKAKIVAEQRAAQAVADKKAEDDRLALAKEQEDAGNTEVAEAVVNAPVPVAVAPAPPARTAPKVKNQRTKYSGEVIDINLVPREYLMVNQQAIDAMARAQKDNFNIAGCQLKKELS